MNVIFTELALTELSETYQYYELEFSGLGVRFKREVKRAVNRIIPFPLVWQKERGDIRKCLLHTTRIKSFILSNWIIYSLSQLHIYIENQTIG